MQIETDELKKLVIWSYELTALMPSPEFDRTGKKYKIESRNKFKSLPESLRHFDDAAASITHFVKNAAYFLPRAEAKVKPEQIMPFVERLIERVMNLNDETKEPEIVREELKLLIGYANWNADAVCAILTAADENSIKAKEMIKKMLEAELTVIHASTELGEIVSKIEPWALKNFGSHNLNEKSQSNKPIFSQKDSNQFKSHNTSSFGKSNVKGLSKFGGKH